MNILQVVPFFPPAWAWGGPVITSYELSKGLVKRGHEVTVYTTDSLDRTHRVDGPKNKPVDLDGIRIYYFRNTSNWMAGKHNIRLPLGIIKEARDNVRKYDIIHLHDYRTPENLIIYHYAKKYGIPYVVHVQGTLTNIGPKRWLKTIYDSLGGYGLLKYASKAIAMTSIEARQYKDFGVSEQDITVIPTSLDLTDFANLPSRGKYRQKFGLGSDDKLILYLGRINQSKGIALLVKTFANLSRKLDNVKLAIAGPDDGYLPELKKLIKTSYFYNDVFLMGPLYGNDKLQAYVDADVFVNPSPFEPYGLVLLEACACGTPVIFSNNCGLAEVLNGQGGITIAYDEKELITALTLLLKDDKLRRELGQCGKSLVYEQFDLPKMIDKMELLYFSCLEKKKRQNSFSL